jgi:hypothetical protein
MISAVKQEATIMLYMLLNKDLNAHVELKAFYSYSSPKKLPTWMTTSGAVTPLM